jgi:hypothetical protein
MTDDDAFQIGGYILSVYLDPLGKTHEQGCKTPRQDTIRSSYMDRIESPTVLDLPYQPPTILPPSLSMMRTTLSLFASMRHTSIQIKNMIIMLKNYSTGLISTPRRGRILSPGHFLIDIADKSSLISMHMVPKRSFSTHSYKLALPHVKTYLDCSTDGPRFSVTSTLAQASMTNLSSPELSETSVLLVRLNSLRRHSDLQYTSPSHLSISIRSLPSMEFTSGYHSFSTALQAQINSNNLANRIISLSMTSTTVSQALENPPFSTSL